ncbi:DinB family protein [Deinococcus sp. QL22]|uniref:DinB family protein n=1 Tax=Deinococcus sp. QL22 TaxID=2939437 RepID=UPI002017E397|nr:DinB family protein [Deinococcus sp. QL22]UQN09220.1 DinB family protein [Deinococcus sp. QL22]
MTHHSDSGLLGALLEAWNRNNTILMNLLHVLPEGGLEAKATPGSPSIAELLTHIRFIRICTVYENDPEFARRHAELALQDEDEWLDERDPVRLAQMLQDSAGVVRDAVKGWVEAGRGRVGDYAHPVLLLQHLLWHEGYHVGQMKLALKITGRPLSDQEAGPATWNVWRH